MSVCSERHIITEGVIWRWLFQDAYIQCSLRMKGQITMSDSAKRHGQFAAALLLHMLDLRGALIFGR